MCALALPGSLSGQAPSAAPADAVWHWFGACAARDSLVLEVVLDGQPIYTSTFPICQVPRGRKTPEPQQRFLAFKLRALPRRFRAGEPGDKPELITGTMWETGGDRNSIRLGLSFATDQLVLLNTNHPARVDIPTLTERVRGLKITTRPVRRPR